MQENDDMIARLLEHPVNVPRFTPLTREEVHARLSGKTSEVQRQELGPPVVTEERPSPDNEDRP